MDNNHNQEIYSVVCGLDDPEEIEVGMHELLMKSSGSIGYRTKISMKAVDDTGRAYAIHPEMRRPLQE